MNTRGRDALRLSDPTRRSQDGESRNRYCDLQAMAHLPTLDFAEGHRLETRKGDLLVRPRKSPKVKLRQKIAQPSSMSIAKEDNQRITQQSDVAHHVVHALVPDQAEIESST